MALCLQGLALGQGARSHLGARPARAQQPLRAQRVQRAAGRKVLAVLEKPISDKAEEEVRSPAARTDGRLRIRPPSLRAYTPQALADTLSIRNRLDTTVRGRRLRILVTRGPWRVTTATWRRVAERALDGAGEMPHVSSSGGPVSPRGRRVWTHARTNMQPPGHVAWALRATCFAPATDRAGRFSTVAEPTTHVAVMGYGTQKKTIQQMLNKEYKFGWKSDIESEAIPKGLSEDTVRLISAKKKEPEWMLEFRLKAYRRWLTMKEPTWSDNHYPPIDFNNIVFYSEPKVHARTVPLLIARWSQHFYPRVQSLCTVGVSLSTTMNPT